VTTARDDTMDMSDLSNLLGDVYGDHSPDAAPVRRESAASERAPEWSSDGRVFDGSVPDAAPAQASAPVMAAAPQAAPTPDPVPMPTLAHAAADAPVATRGGWTASPAVAAPASVMVSAPVSSSPWRPGDDDIFPMAKGASKKARTH